MVLKRKAREEKIVVNYFKLKGNLIPEMFDRLN